MFPSPVLSLRADSRCCGTTPYPLPLPSLQRRFVVGHVPERQQLQQTFAACSRWLLGTCLRRVGSWMERVIQTLSAGGDSVAALDLEPYTLVSPVVGILKAMLEKKTLDPHFTCGHSQSGASSRRADGTTCRRSGQIPWLGSPGICRHSGVSLLVTKGIQLVYVGLLLSLHLDLA